MSERKAQARFARLGKGRKHETNFTDGAAGICFWFRGCGAGSVTMQRIRTSTVWKSTLKCCALLYSGRTKAETSLWNPYGAENLPEQDGFVMYPNHQGLYDVLAIAGACSRTLQLLPKKRGRAYSVLKQVFACIHALFMDRENLRQSMQVINEAADVVKEGKNVILFPEGTRSRKGNQLLEFKKWQLQDRSKKQNARSCRLR